MSILDPFSPHRTAGSICLTNVTAPTRIGVVSDTHRTKPDERFTALVETCFAGVRHIIHAGDLTDLSVLAAFGGREVYAVHGNMCRPSSSVTLPKKRILEVGGFRIGIVHHAGYGYDFEDELLNEFDGAVHCIVYGHTHIPVCHKTGGVLYVNPGSFQAGHGRAATYAILSAGDTLTAELYEAPRA